MGKYKFGKRSIRNIHTVDKMLQNLAARTIELSEVDFGVLDNGGLRTAEMQNELFKLSYSKCDGYKKKSYHQSGMAIDYVPYINGRYTWSNISLFEKINEAVIKAWNDLPYKEEYKLIWGATWKSFKDYPHYELRKI